MVQLAIAFKKATYVGEGENLFHTVGILLPPYVFTVRFTHFVALGASGRPRRSV
jgi:hypothetical protein